MFVALQNEEGYAQISRKGFKDLSERTNLKMNVVGSTKIVYEFSGALK
jgi:hypothetical protein